MSGAQNLTQTQRLGKCSLKRNIRKLPRHTMLIKFGLRVVERIEQADCKILWKQLWKSSAVDQNTDLAGERERRGDTICMRYEYYTTLPQHFYLLIEGKNTKRSRDGWMNCLAIEEMIICHWNKSSETRPLIRTKIATKILMSVCIPLVVKQLSIM